MAPSILILSACSGEKAFDEVVTCADIDGSSKEELVNGHPDRSLPARSLYTGDEHGHVTEAVDRFEAIADVDWRIISAGFGLVRPDTELPAYECTFRNTDSVRRRVERMGYDPDSLTQQEQVQRVARELGIPDEIEEALKDGIDVAFVVLGEDYLNAAGSSLSSIPEDCRAFAFAAEGNRDLIGECQWVPSTETERDALGTTWTQVKGYQLKNVADNVASADDLLNLENAASVREKSLCI